VTDSNADAGIALRDSANLDAFARLRVSQPAKHCRHHRHWRGNHLQGLCGRGRQQRRIEQVARLPVAGHHRPDADPRAGPRGAEPHRPQHRGDWHRRHGVRGRRPDLDGGALTWRCSPAPSTPR